DWRTRQFSVGSFSHFLVSRFKKPRGNAGDFVENGGSDAIFRARIFCEHDAAESAAVAERTSHPPPLTKGRAANRQAGR
ncbi:MAG TPA: hypothetical protein VNF27_00910, partial [Candidatus Binataceae bacterium]|nr:hypothetical protein [Candidatus Binataceae bacterium]